MNSEAIYTLLTKNPALKASKAKLEAMKPETYVVHRSWGFGQISGYDEVSQKLIIDFKTKKAHPMDLVFCVNTMEVLPPHHILVRQETDMGAIQKLIDDNPVQFVIEVLSGYKDHAASSTEFETTVAQVVGENKFRRWFSGVKKKIAKEPRISMPVKKNERYVLREEPVSAEDEILELFSNTNSARRRIFLAEELLGVSLTDKSAARLEPVLNGISEIISNSNQLNEGERLYSAYIRDKLAKKIGQDPSKLVPSQGKLVQEPRALNSMAGKIPVHFQSEFLALIKASHPLEWREAVFSLLKTSQGKFTTECISFLLQNGQSNELAATLARWKTEQNLRAPVLLWIVKNRHSKKFAKLLNDLITPRLLSSIFFAIDYEALQSAGIRRIPLADALADDSDLISNLLSTANTETACDLANTLMLSQGFEELTKKSLLARFIKLFPSLQSLVAGESEAKDDQHIVSRSSYERRCLEYEELISKKIPNNSKAIAAAREHGDLRENSEFKMTKQDQAVLMAKKTQLEWDLARARVTDFRDASTDQISIGTTIGLRDIASGSTVRYTLLGAWDSEPENNIIAYKTPLGQVLLGKKVGENVQLSIAGVQHRYQIASITRYAI